MFVLLRGHRYNSRCIIGIRDTETFNKSYMAHRAHGSGHIVFYSAAHHESSAHWVLLPVLRLSVAGMTFVFLRAAGAAVTFGSVRDLGRLPSTYITNMIICMYTQCLTTCNSWITCPTSISHSS